MQERRVAFVGAGIIAQAHAYALAALPYYYADAPKITRVAVASSTPEGARRFQSRYGFAEALSPEEVWGRGDIDAVFILSPNETHYPYFKRAFEMPSVQRIYVEKPVCVSEQEEEDMRRAVAGGRGGLVVHAGFQFLQMAAVRRALALWREEDFGPAIHFHARYLHGSYLDESYRRARRSKLLAARAGGALADLGPHALSFLVAFLGEGLTVTAAAQSGAFPDVPAASDLCTALLLRDEKTGAVGTVTASRISAGAGDLLELEVRAARGALCLSTEAPDVLRVFKRAGGGQWLSVYCGNDYAPLSSFPSRQTPTGWLRSLVHAHYLFFGGVDGAAAVPDIAHALAVQRLIRLSAGHLVVGGTDERHPV